MGESYQEVLLWPSKPYILLFQLRGLHLFLNQLPPTSLKVDPLEELLVEWVALSLWLLSL